MDENFLIIHLSSKIESVKEQISIEYTPSDTKMLRISIFLMKNIFQISVKSSKKMRILFANSINNLKLINQCLHRQVYDQIETQ